MEKGKVISNMTIHELKTVQPYFDDVLLHGKNFEVRKNDRDFKVGDSVMLMEWSKENGFSGRYISAEITYILDSKEYCKEGYVVLGIKIENIGLLKD